MNAIRLMSIAICFHVACATNRAAQCVLPQVVPIEEAIAKCASQGGDPVQCTIDFVTGVLAPYLSCLDPVNGREAVRRLQKRR